VAAYTGFVRNARNVAIVMVLALGVAFAPHGGNVVDAIFTAITMGFLAGIAWMLYTLSRQNQLTLATLSDRRRAIFYGAFGMIALLIAGTDELFASGGGTLLWILLLGASVAAIWRIWVEANTY
jgi:Sec-independent protein secretion pathway component TatC